MMEIQFPPFHRILFWYLVFLFVAWDHKFLYPLFIFWRIRLLYLLRYNFLHFFTGPWMLSSFNCCSSFTDCCILLTQTSAILLCSLLCWHKLLRFSCVHWLYFADANRNTFLVFTDYVLLAQNAAVLLCSLTMFCWNKLIQFSCAHWLFCWNKLLHLFLLIHVSKLSCKTFHTASLFSSGKHSNFLNCGSKVIAVCKVGKIPYLVV